MENSKIVQQEEWDPPKRDNGVRVYFIRSGDGGPIKIGVSEYPRRRMAGLQTDHYEQLILIGTVSGGYAREAKLHERFKHLNIRGEWFRAESDLVNAIKEMLYDEHPTQHGIKPWHLIEVDAQPTPTPTTEE